MRSIALACSLAVALPAAAQLSSFALQEAASPAGSWHTLGGTTYRSFVSSSPLPHNLASPAWLCTFDASGARIRWISQASPVVTRELVIAPGIVSPAGGPANQLRLFALHRSTGTIAWATTLPISASALSLESQSVPAIDPLSSSIIYPHGSTLSCLSLFDGSIRWQTPLGRLVVNASPVIASDVPGARRAYITTFDAAAGTGGELLCINLDSFDAATNPHAPGGIVWRAPIGGSSGNSPAFLSRSVGGIGLVYVASAGSYAQTPPVPGSIFAFEAAASLVPTPTWQVLNTTPEGFYGGVSIDIGRIAWGHIGAGAPPAPRPTLAASTYAFSGGLQSANTLLIDCGSGLVRKCSSSNRTSSTPIWLPSGRLLLSTGLSSTSVADTAPAIELFGWPSQWSDSCSLLGQLWNSASATWLDTNGDVLMTPGEYLAVGHYIHHPAVSSFAGRTLACVGTAPNGDRVSPPTQLRVIDLDASPTSPSFIVTTAGAQVGGSPALAGLNLYSSGAGGLAAFGIAPTSLDVDASGTTTLADLHAWEAALGNRDVDGSGAVSQADRDALLLALRSRERFALTNMGITRVGGLP